jgi:tetratricopeptide (TPR) repeat protein
MALNALVGGLFDREEHAHSRYQCVTTGVISALQRAYAQGRDLGQVFDHIDGDMAAVIVAETLEADRIWNLSPDRLLSSYNEGRMSDYKRAVTAEIFFSVAEPSRKQEGRSEDEKRCWAFAMAELEEILQSPLASPLLWYEDIFFRVAQGVRYGGDDPDALQESIQWYKRGLKHNLRFNEGDNVHGFLRDIAEAYLWEGEMDQGLKMLTTLLRNDPDDIWIYNGMTFVLNHCGLPTLARIAAMRGLELIDATGDPERLRSQIQGLLGDIPDVEAQNRESELDPEVVVDLKAAMALDFDAGCRESPEAFCHRLVPDVDEMPVKRPMRPSDLPLPQIQAHGDKPPRRQNRPGRNDPCWCGSGKKYKHCHWREDQKRG